MEGEEKSKSWWRFEHDKGMVETGPIPGQPRLSVR